MKVQLDENIKMWKRQLQLQDERIEQMRAIKHDMEAHFVVLKYYLEEEKYDAAREYLGELIKRQERLNLGKQVDVGNALLNALICEYLEKSEDEIEFFLKGVLPAECQVKDYDLCIIFSNLMSNAVEACERLEKKNKWIGMNITSDERGVRLYVENPKEWHVDESCIGNSTKENPDEHGYGTQNIKHIVESLHGTCCFKISEEVFGVEIYLPYGEKNN